MIRRTLYRISLAYEAWQMRRKETYCLKYGHDVVTNTINNKVRHLKCINCKAEEIVEG